MFFNNIKMTNRLIYFAPPAGERPRQATENQPQGAPKFQGDGTGKLEYEELAAKIDKIDTTKLTAQDVFKLFGDVDTFNHGLLNAEIGLVNTHLKGQASIDLYRKLREKIGVTMDMLPAILKKQATLPSYVNESLGFGLCLYFNPVEAFAILEKNLPPIWDNNMVSAVANQMVASGAHFQFIPEIKSKIPQILSDIYNKHFDRQAAKTSKDPAVLSLNSWLEAQVNLYAPKVSPAIGFLSEKGVAALTKARQKSFYDGKFVEKPENVQQMTVTLADAKSKEVEAIFAGDDYLKGEESPSDRAVVAAIIFWSYLDGLKENFRIPLPEKKKAQEAYNAFFKQNGLESYFYWGPRGNVSEEIAKQVAEDAPVTIVDFSEEEAGELVAGAPDYQNLQLKKPEALPIALKKSPNEKELDEKFRNFSTLTQSVIIKLDSKQPVTKEERSKLNDVSQELRDLLLQQFGTDYVVSLKPYQKREIEEAVNYYEIFTNALNNVVLVKQYKEELDKLEAETIGANKKPTIEQVHAVRTVYKNLKGIDYLPSEKDYAEHKNLLRKAERLYQRLAVTLGLPPKINTEDSPYVKTGKDENMDDWGEEPTPYTYSPMTDSTAEGDESDEAQEIPEVMDLQLNRIGLLESLASGMLAIANINKENHGYISGVTNGLTTVHNALIAYYNDEKYDGKTPFNLDGALKANPEFGAFLESAKDFFAVDKDPSVFTTKMLGGAQAEFEKFIKKQHGDGNDDFQRLCTGAAEIRRHAFFNDFAALLKGESFTRESIKKAGALIAIYTRRSLRDYQSARALMAKLLQPHMPKWRERAEKGRLVWNDTKKTFEWQIDDAKRAPRAEELRRKAEDKASSSVMRYLGSGGRKDVEADLRGKIRDKFAEENPGKELPNDVLDGQVGRLYSSVFDMMISAQTEILYELMLNDAAIAKSFSFDTSKKDYDWFNGNGDEADHAIMAEYVDSVDPDSADDNISDETAEFWRNLGNMLATIAKEVAIFAVAMIATAGVGAVARLMMRGGVWLTKSLLGIAEVSRIMKWTYRIAEGAVLLTAKGFSFGQIYPSLHEALTGKEGTTILETLSKSGWGQATLHLLSEMAMVGTTEGLIYLARYLKYGKAGRGLLWMAEKEPEAAPAINAVFKSLEKLKPEEAMKALDEMIAKGVVRHGGKEIRIPENVAKYLKETVTDASQLREKYAAIISGLENDTAKKVLTYLLRDMHYDAIAMLLGTLAKEGVYHADGHEAFDFSASTILQTYLMGAVFKGSFLALGKVTENFAGLLAKLNVKSPLEAIPVLEAKLVELRALKAESKTSFEQASAPVRESIAVSERSVTAKETLIAQRGAQLRRVTPGGKKANARRKAIELEIATLRSEVTALKEGIEASKRQLQEASAKHEQVIAEADKQITEWSARQAELQKAIDEAPLKEGPVNSRIARLLPKQVREHIWSHYKLDGKFLDSHAFAKLVMDDFPAALKILKGAKRSVLSPNQVLALTLRLDSGQRKLLLRETGRMFTLGQRRHMLKLLERMEISDADIPRDFAKGLEPRARLLKFREALIALWLICTASAASAETPKATETVGRKDAIELVATDFVPANGQTPQGKLFFTSKSYEKWDGGRDGSGVLVIKGKVTGSGDEAKLVGESGAVYGAGRSVPKGLEANFRDGLFSKDYKEDQNKILDAVKQIAGSMQKTAEETKAIVARMGEYFERVPDELKPYIRVIAEPQGNRLQPYVVVDQKGLSEMYTGMEGADKRVDYPTIQTLKAQDLVEENGQHILTTDWIARLAHKGGKNGDFFMWWFAMAAGWRLVAGMKQKRLLEAAGMNPETRSLLALKDGDGALKRTFKILGFFTQPLWLTHKITKEGVPLATERDAGSLATTPALDRILTAAELGTLSPAERALLDGSYNNLSNNFKWMTFRNINEGNNMFNALVRLRFLQIKLETTLARRAANATELPAATGRKTTLEGEVGALEGDPNLVRAETLDVEIRVLEGNPNLVRAEQLDAIIVARKAAMAAHVAAAPPGSRPTLTQAYKNLKNPPGEPKMDVLEAELVTLKTPDPTMTAKIGELQAKRRELGTLKAADPAIDARTTELRAKRSELVDATAEEARLTAEAATIEPEINRIVGEMQAPSEQTMNSLWSPDAFSPQIILEKGGVDKMKSLLMTSVDMMEGITPADRARLDAYLTTQLPKLRNFLRKHPNLADERANLILAKTKLQAGKTEFERRQARVTALETLVAGGTALTPAQRIELAQSRAFVDSYGRLRTWYEGEMPGWKNTWQETKNFLDSTLDTVPRRLAASAAATGIVGLILHVAGVNLEIGKHENLEGGEITGDYSGNGGLLPNPTKTAEELEKSRDDAAAKAAAEGAKGAPVEVAPEGAPADPNAGKPVKLSPDVKDVAPVPGVEQSKDSIITAPPAAAAPAEDPEAVKARAQKALDESFEEAMPK